MIAMTIAANITLPRSTSILREGFKFRLAGLALIALLPALFWSMVLAYAGQYFGIQMTFAGLAAVAGGIGIFLSAVCLPIMMTRS
jgi:hypothetical protein